MAKTHQVDMLGDGYKRISLKVLAIFLFLLAVRETTSIQSSLRSFHFVDTDNVTIKVVHRYRQGHLTPSCYKIHRHGQHFSFCYPSLVISGFEKCGTSALYALLDSHPQVVQSVPKHKEYCLGQKTFFKFFKGFRKAQLAPGVSKNKIILNGCLNWEENLKVFNILQGPKSIYITMVREPSSYFWAGFNFWCNPNLDVSCPEGGWTIVGKSYRTPELYHELIMSQRAHENAKGHFLIPTCERIKTLFTSRIAYLESGMKTSINIFAAETLETEPTRVWNQIQHLIQKKFGISVIPHPDVQGFAQLRINDGNFRGEKRVTNKSRVYGAGLYAVSNFRPILPQTKVYIRSCWKECRNISRLTGYQFAC